MICHTRCDEFERKQFENRIGREIAYQRLLCPDSNDVVLNLCRKTHFSPLTKFNAAPVLIVPRPASYDSSNGLFMDTLSQPCDRHL